MKLHEMRHYQTPPPQDHAAGSQDPDFHAKRWWLCRFWAFTFLAVLICATVVMCFSRSLYPAFAFLFFTTGALRMCRWLTVIFLTPREASRVHIEREPFGAKILTAMEKVCLPLEPKHEDAPENNKSKLNHPNQN